MAKAYIAKGKRVEKGKTQKGFAAELGITPQYLNEIEKGKVSPRLNLAMLIAEKLGSTVDELFCR
jgi:putative transcriptional regulator